jgi:hypothetical protein
MWRDIWSNDATLCVILSSLLLFTPSLGHSLSQHLLSKIPSPFHVMCLTKFYTQHMYAELTYSVLHLQKSPARFMWRVLPSSVPNTCTQYSHTLSNFAKNPQPVSCDVSYQVLYPTHVPSTHILCLISPKIPSPFHVMCLTKFCTHLMYPELTHSVSYFPQIVPICTISQ